MEEKGTRKKKGKSEGKSEGRGIHKKNGKYECERCHHMIGYRAQTIHDRSCLKKEEIRKRDREALAELEAESRRPRKAPRLRSPSLEADAEVAGPSSVEHPLDKDVSFDFSHTLDETAMSDMNMADGIGGSSIRGSVSPEAQPMSLDSPQRAFDSHRSEPSPSPESSVPAGSLGASDVSGNAADTRPWKDDIKVQFHPASKRDEKVYHFENYSRERPDCAEVNPTPWEPFNGRDDFEFANAVLKARMTNAQIKTLLDIITRIRRNESDFTLSSLADYQNAWDAAKLACPPFEKHTISVPYGRNGELREFEVYARDIAQVIRQQVEDPNLAQYMQWDARRMSKWDDNDQRWEQFWEAEPVQGSMMWDAQTNIPEGGTPLGIYLYADKNKLSSFGTQQGYPVIMRLTNIEADKRHGTGLGGGQVIGFLPIVPEDAKESGKPAFVNLKRQVWHEAMRKILGPLESLSKLGLAVRCGDKVERCLYPFFNILAGDYEEQCSMVLIRGNNCLYPCPVCLVPKELLADLHQEHDLRTMEQSKHAVTIEDRGERDDACRQLGLRPILNLFWDFNNTDPHKAVSFDQLHWYQSGLFGHHLWGEFKKVVEDLPRTVGAGVDEGIQKMPPWRGLDRFSHGALHISFTNGSKYNDLSKILVFASHNAVSRDQSPRGYALLKLIRKYVECNMFASFEVHTESTLASFGQAISEFGTLLEEYQTHTTNSDDVPEKDWNFVKAHMQLHAILDVRRKGALSSMTTKQSEKFHGPMRKNYLMRTNFKNVISQLAALNHIHLCAEVIEENVRLWDEYLDAERRAQKQAGKENEDAAQPSKSHTSRTRDVTPFQSHQIYLGASQGQVTFDELEKTYQGNIAFKHFRRRLKQFLICFLNTPANFSSATALPIGSYNVNLKGHDKITEFRFLRIDFESTVTWETETDYLRCNPDFHRKSRYDYIIFNSEGGPTFAKLVYIFVCEAGGQKIPLALIQGMDKGVGGRLRIVDKDLGFHRMKSTDPSKSRFIPLRSVVRGALLCQDSQKADEYIIVDTIDTDMFLRIRQMFPERYR